jgi:hypothetical protein
MKHVSLEKSQEAMREKSSIAWFKLAEVITRGEKERALGIYRLLMHSISDDAIKAQLEGDILRIFNDPAAVQSYGRAAELYQKNNEAMQASLLYEVIISLLLLQNDFNQAYVVVRNSHLEQQHKAVRYEQLAVGMLLAGAGAQEALLQQIVVAALKNYQDEWENNNKISRFLAKLAALDEEVYAYACEQALIA